MNRVLLLATLVASSSAAEPVRLSGVPTALPDSVREALVRRREEIREGIRRYNVALNEVYARCRGVKSTDSGYAQCVSEEQTLASGSARLDDMKRAFNADVEAALRAAQLAPSVRLGNIVLVGDVHLQGPDGKELDAGRIASLDIPLGTKIVTGPGGDFRADVPGHHSIHLGAGAELTIDTVFTSSSGLGQLAVNLSHGFFQWVRNEQEMIKAWKDSGRFRVRTPTAVTSVRGTDVAFDLDSTGAGSIKLFSGEVVVMSKDSTRRVALKPRQMLTISPDGVISDPTPLPPAELRKPIYSRRRGR